MKPPFTYFGGKTAIASKIAGLLPAHEHYVEPFAGSLAVLLAKPPSASAMETVNDIDGDMMNFWRVLRDRPAELIRLCASTPHARAMHEEALTPPPGCPGGTGWPGPAESDVERAWRLWVVLTQGRSGKMAQRTGWRYYQDPRGSSSSMPDYLAAYVARLAPAAARLAEVSLECSPALTVIGRYGQHPSNLIYADPPYLGSLRKKTRGRSRGPSYVHELRTDAEHAELLESLLACKAAVVLSGYASPLYDRALDGWDRAEIATQTGNGGADRGRVEVLWSNRPFPRHIQDGLFGNDHRAGLLH